MYVEVMVLCDVVLRLGNYCLFGCILYVIFELCVMCSGVIMYVCIVCVVFGVIDFKIGVVGSVINFYIEECFNYYVNIEGGVLVGECGVLLFFFFVVCCSKILMV